MQTNDYYTVYADYGVNDPRTHEYRIGTLEETQKWIDRVLNHPETTLKNVGQLTMVIRDWRGRTVSIHPVVK